jgi:hypothetical protein
MIHRNSRLVVTTSRSSHSATHKPPEPQKWLAVWLVLGLCLPVSAKAAEYPAAVTFARVALDEATVHRFFDCLAKADAITQAMSPLLRQAEALQAQKDKFTHILQAQRMKKPSLIDSASRLRQDEFETREQFANRVARAKQADQEKWRTALGEWERLVMNAERWCDQQAKEVDGELRGVRTKLEALENDHAAAVAEQRLPIECTLQWFPPASLTRFDMETVSFPNVRLTPNTVHAPRQMTLLYRGVAKGAPAVVCGPVAGTGQFCFRAAGVDAARRFKADWEQRQIIVQQKATITLRTYTPNFKVIEEERVVHTEVKKKTFDGEDAVNVVGNLALILLGMEATPDIQAHTMYTARPDRDRGYTSKSTEVRPEKSFVANAFIVDCVLGEIAVLKKDGNRVIPVDAVTLEPCAALGGQ